MKWDGRKLNPSRGQTMCDRPHGPQSPIRSSVKSDCEDHALDHVLVARSKWHLPSAELKEQLHGIPAGGLHPGRGHHRERLTPHDRERLALGRGQALTGHPHTAARAGRSSRVAVPTLTQWAGLLIPAVIEPGIAKVLDRAHQ